MDVRIRPYQPTDEDGLWAAFEPALRSGEVFAWPRDAERAEGLRYRFAGESRVFSAVVDGAVAGSYYLRKNQAGGGDHVANCGYLVHPDARGKGVARALCKHSMQTAREAGFTAMQFNFVVSTNEDAVHLWKSLGFAIVGTLPGAFRHPRLGCVDAFVMYRQL